MRAKDLLSLQSAPNNILHETDIFGGPLKSCLLGNDSLAQFFKVIKQRLLNDVFLGVKTHDNARTLDDQFVCHELLQNHLRIVALPRNRGQEIRDRVVFQRNQILIEALQLGLKIK